MDNSNPNPTPDPANSPADAGGINADNKDQKDKGSTTDPADAQAAAYRKQQSRADKATSQFDDISSRMEFLEGVVGETVRDRLVDNFLKDNKDKFPDVTRDDLVDFVSSPEDIEKLATHLQKKVNDKIKTALADVREVPSEDTMTAEEKAKALAELEKKPDRNSFAKFLRLQATKVKK